MSVGRRIGCSRGKGNTRCGLRDVGGNVLREESVESH